MECFPLIVQSVVCKDKKIDLKYVKGDLYRKADLINMENFFLQSFGCETIMVFASVTETIQAYVPLYVKKSLFVVHAFVGPFFHQAIIMQCFWQEIIFHTLFPTIHPQVWIWCWENNVVHVTFPPFPIPFLNTVSIHPAQFIRILLPCLRFYRGMTYIFVVGIEKANACYIFLLLEWKNTYVCSKFYYLH